jgi:transaldolase
LPVTAEPSYRRPAWAARSPRGLCFTRTVLDKSAMSTGSLMKEQRSEARPGGDAMNATGKLHALGQSIWLDNITRDLLESGTLRRYIDELSVTGLTSNPTIFDHAISNSATYDDPIRRGVQAGRPGEDLFFDLALEDLTQAADLFKPIFERTGGVDGWVSLEVSPLLAHDTASTLAAARSLHDRAGRPNLFIKIPGTPEGLPAIEEAIFAGIPVNVTLLFSREQYVAAAEAWLRGIERRIAAGLDPAVGSVASVFISRWDVSVAGKIPPALSNRLGIAIGQRTYKAYQDLLGSPRWQSVMHAGARAQRLLWASTGTKDPKAPDILYVKALAAPLTVNTMPEATLKAFADHGEVGEPLPADGGDVEAELGKFAGANVDVYALATRLQDEGAKAFVESWTDLMSRIETKGAAAR